MFKLFTVMFNVNQIIKMTLENALRSARKQRRADLSKRAAIGLLRAYALAAQAKRQIGFYRSL